MFWFKKILPKIYPLAYLIVLIKDWNNKTQNKWSMNTWFFHWIDEFGKQHKVDN